LICSADDLQAGDCLTYLEDCEEGPQWSLHLRRGFRGPSWLFHYNRWLSLSNASRATFSPEAMAESTQRTQATNGNRNATWARWLLRARRGGSEMAKPDESAEHT